MSKKEERSECVFSPDGAHRYSLTHRWADGSIVMWIGLNPSTANSEQLDPTLRRIKSFSASWGHGAFVMTNLFAFRSTDPDVLWRRFEMQRGSTLEGVSIVGEDNDATLRLEAKLAHTIVACWGVHGSLGGRADQVRRLLSAHRLHHLGLTKSGQPRHPLYLKASTPLQPWI